MLTSDVEGLVVYSKDMMNLGKAKDVEFDPAEMKITSIVVEFEKEAAKELLGKRIVLRHAKGKVPTSSIESIKDALILKQSWTDLKGSIESL